MFVTMLEQHVYPTRCALVQGRKPPLALEIHSRQSTQFRNGSSTFTVPHGDFNMLFISFDPTRSPSTHELFSLWSGTISDMLTICEQTNVNNLLSFYNENIIKNTYVQTDAGRRRRPPRSTARALTSGFRSPSESLGDRDSGAQGTNWGATCSSSMSESSEQRPTSVRTFRCPENNLAASSYTDRAGGPCRTLSPVRPYTRMNDVTCTGSKISDAFS